MGQERTGYKFGWITGDKEGSISKGVDVIDDGMGFWIDEKPGF